MKRIHIHKREAARCVVCQSTDTRYVVSYRDPDKEPAHRFPDGTVAATDIAWACAAHAAQVTEILIQRNGERFSESGNDSFDRSVFDPNSGLGRG
jgi:hypothetical protein